MVDRLLVVSITILRLLYGKTLWVNNIIEQTSGDRTYVLAVLEYMSKANLLTQGPRRIGQKRSTELTTLGNEIASVMNDLDNFKDCYLDIVKFYRNNHVDFEEDVDEATVRSILRSRGWEEDDINVRRDSTFGSTFRLYRDLFVERMLDIVHYRSLKILNKYKINLHSKNNEIIISIFEGILLDVIAFVYGNFLTEGKTKDNRSGKEFEINEWIKSKERRLLGPLGGYSDLQIPFFAMDELRKLSLSYLKLVDPGRDTLQREIHELKQRFESRHKSVSAKGLKHVGTNVVLEVMSKELSKIKQPN